MQQHAVPEGRQGEQSTDVRVQKLRFQATSRQQLHLREQNYARNRRVDAHSGRRDIGPHLAENRRASLPQMQLQRSGVLSSADQKSRGGDEVILRVHQSALLPQMDRIKLRLTSANVFSSFLRTLRVLRTCTSKQ